MMMLRLSQSMWSKEYCVPNHITLWFTEYGDPFEKSCIDKVGSAGMDMRLDAEILRDELAKFINKATNTSARLYNYSTESEQYISSVGRKLKFKGSGGEGGAIGGVAYSLVTGPNLARLTPLAECNALSWFLSGQDVRHLKQIQFDDRIVKIHRRARPLSDIGWLRGVLSDLHNISGVILAEWA